MIFIIHFSFLRIEFEEQILNLLLVIYFFVHCKSYGRGIVARLGSLDPARGDLGLPRVSAELAGDLFYSRFSCFSFLSAR